VASEGPRSVREELAALRIDRASAGASRRPAWLLPAGIAAAALLLALLALAVWRATLGAPTVVRVAYASVSQPGATPVGSVLSGSGYVVTGDKYISIGVRVPGRIEEYLVDESDRVVAGQPLVRLDEREYQAALEQAQAGLTLASANIALYEKELERLRTLRSEGVASESQFDIKENQLRVARAEAARLRAEIAQARVNLDYTVLRAPTSGVVLAKLKEVGEIAVPGGFAGSGDLIRMANLDDLRAEVDVNEADLSRVRLEQAAEVVPDAYPDRRYAAKVVKLYPQVNRQKGTLKVEARILEPDDWLRPDMSVRVNFLAESADAAEGPGEGAPVVLAPRSAIRGGDGDAYVWVVTEQRLRRQPVELAATAGDPVPIAAGLAGGEALVVSDEAPLREGARVELAP
jgi:RND family efflux transporter MFP subunit